MMAHYGFLISSSHCGGTPGYMLETPTHSNCCSDWLAACVTCQNNTESGNVVETYIFLLLHTSYNGGRCHGRIGRCSRKPIANTGSATTFSIATSVALRREHSKEEEEEEGERGF